MSTPLLFSPLTLRGLEVANRLWMPPMCQYSAVDGLVQPWHRRHYLERAIGGAGLLLVEATGVQARGRISPACLGLWNDAQAEAFAPLVADVHAAGAKFGIQLAHAGRKASTQVPWVGSGAVATGAGGWEAVGPGSEPFDPTYPVPRALTDDEILEVVADFAQAARRAVAAGFDTVEIHGAHGYLIHQFLSPLTNHRSDRWGGSFENRTRLARDVVAAVRKVIPDRMPLLLRLSATDWVEGGWDADQTVALVRQLKDEGVDLVDTSTGGVVPGVKITLGPGYQVPFAGRIRREAGVPTAAVGLITDATQAEALLQAGEADAVLMGRQLLRDPYYPARTAPADRRTLPPQYLRAF